MGYVLVDPPASFATADLVAEAMRWIGGSSAAHQSDVAFLIDEAVRAVGQAADRVLGTATWRLELDAFADAIELPVEPVAAISALTYVDAEGVQQTVSPDDYTVDLVSKPQWLVRNADVTWPETLDAVNVVRVTFVAGEAELAAPFKGAVFACVARWFDRRDEVGTLPKDVARTINALRPVRI